MVINESQDESNTVFQASCVALTAWNSLSRPGWLHTLAVRGLKGWSPEAGTFSQSLILYMSNAPRSHLRSPCCRCFQDSLSFDNVRERYECLRKVERKASWLCKCLWVLRYPLLELLLKPETGGQLKMRTIRALESKSLTTTHLTFFTYSSVCPCIHVDEDAHVESEDNSVEFLIYYKIDSI